MNEPRGRAGPRRWISHRPPRWKTGPASRSLGHYVAEHLRRKRLSQECSERWLTCVTRHLEEATTFLGQRTPIDGIDLRQVEAYLVHLLEVPNGRGGSLSPDTINHYLNSLSNLFRRAKGDGWIVENPVDLLMHRPARRSAPVVFLEVDEVADVLAWARTYRSPRPDLATDCLLEIVATFAYTGVRKAEAFGLLRGDVDLRRGVIHVRHNQWRRLKNGESERTVPIFSELSEILEPYLTRHSRQPYSLLFSSPVTGGPIQNLRRQFNRAPLPARLIGQGGSAPLALRTRLLRHSYCAARLQTTDNGAPISPFTVARELGHADLDMVLQIYGHLGRVRHRGPEVSYYEAGSCTT